MLRRSLIPAMLLLILAASGCAARNQSRPLISSPEKDDESEFCMRTTAPAGLAAMPARPPDPRTRAGWRTTP